MTNRIILEVYQDVTIQVLIYLSKAYYCRCGRDDSIAQLSYLGRSTLPIKPDNLAYQIRYIKKRI